MRTGPRAAVRPLAVAALGFALAAGCLNPRGTAESPAIVSRDFRGLKTVNESELEDKLATKASGRFSWGETRLLDEDAVEADRRRIVAFYKERGYYAARVDEVEVQPAGEGRVRVVFHVHEGDPVRVTKVEVLGLEAAPEARAAAGKLPLREGQIFTWAAYDAARAQLQSALTSTGYATGTVTQRAVVRASAGTAEVTYEVAPGKRYRFGPIAVTGISGVPEAKIEARAEKLAPRGDFYDERKLDRIQSRVFELGVFSGVRVSRGTPAPEGDEVPVSVNVREAPFRTLRLGPGVGIEPSLFQVIGQASWVDRNWLGDLRRLKFDLRGGYAWIPRPLSPIREGWVGDASVEFTQVDVLFRGAMDLAAKLEVEKTLQQAYGANSLKTSFGTPSRLAERWMFTPSYNFQIYRLMDFVGDPSLLPVQNCPSELCILSYFEQRITWDGRDHPLLTTSGAWTSLALQEGIPSGSIGYTFLRFQPEVRAFWPIARGSVLAGRAMFGAIVPLHEKGPAPLPALFTSGGPSSMRGYGSERLSPMILQNGSWVPTGGNGVLDASLELRQALTGSWIGVLFLDAGNVSTASGNPTQYAEVFDLTKLQLALGVGARYRTPVGPFRADFAVRLPNDFAKGVPFGERFPAVPGNSGHREPIAVLSVGLGEAF